MEDNTGVWSRYNSGFVDPLFVPYLLEETTDPYGNKISVNKWKQQGSLSAVNPLLVRINKGMTFMRMFQEDACPPAFVKSEEPGSAYCFKRTLDHEPVLYTDKAFIPKKQYWRGPSDHLDPVAKPKIMGNDLGWSTSAIGGERSATKAGRRVSEQTDLRSMNIYNGNYEVYYLPNPVGSQTRYARPTPGPEKYDTSWNMPRQGNYARMSTNDSYLG